jgi:hypothetical protein
MVKWPRLVMLAILAPGCGTLLDVAVVSAQSSHEEAESRRAYATWSNDPEAQERELERLAEVNRSVDAYRRSAALPPLRRSERAERRQRAWELTKAARRLALAGDCGAVRALDVEMRDVDPDLHHDIFMRDRDRFLPSHAIAMCLATPLTSGHVEPTAHPADAGAPSIDAAP